MSPGQVGAKRGFDPPHSARPRGTAGRQLGIRDGNRTGGKDQEFGYRGPETVVASNLLKRRGAETRREERWAGVFALPSNSFGRVLILDS